MAFTFPNETPEYRNARNGLLDAEIELRRSMEAVAVARRALPAGGAVPRDYVFQGRRDDGSVGDVRLSELFLPGHDALATYNMMFPRWPTDDRVGTSHGETARLPLSETPCPSCTALLDQLDGAVPHLDPRMSFAVVAKAPLDQLLTFAKERGWRHLRLFSAALNTFQKDYHGEVEGGPQPMLNVFHRRAGAIRHFWSSEMLGAPVDPGQDPRHVGTLEPLWNLLDLTPAGRGVLEEQLQYDCCRTHRLA